MNKIENIKNQAINKVQLFVDLNNRENELQQKLGWGPYIVYTYLHTEEYLMEIVTFDDKEDAEAYLQIILDDWASDPDRDNEPWDEEDSDDDTKEYFRIKDWDLPIRRGIHRYTSRTVGLADPREFVEAMPTDFALNFLEGLFWSALVPGYYEEH